MERYASSPLCLFPFLVLVWGRQEQYLEPWNQKLLDTSCSSKLQITFQWFSYCNYNKISTSLLTPPTTFQCASDIFHTLGTWLPFCSWNTPCVFSFYDLCPFTSSWNTLPPNFARFTLVIKVSDQMSHLQRGLFWSDHPSKTAIHQYYSTAPSCLCASRLFVLLKISCWVSPPTLHN